MIHIDFIKRCLRSSQMSGFFAGLYGQEEAQDKKQIDRYSDMADQYAMLFPHYSGGLHVFSTPGRSEIGGNHTDHNFGRVLAAAVNLDSVALAGKTDDNLITVYSKGYDIPFTVELGYLESRGEEEGTTTALIRGIAARFDTLGYKIGGFNAYVSSDVLKGSGLSSSASIEVLLGTILNHLYNGGKVSPEALAMIGQYAENIYFKKPCGLMDQIACAVGGFVAIDFKDPACPEVRRVDFDFSAFRHKLVVVDTKGDHADLTDEYASIPNEMKAVAKALGGNVCREFSMDELLKNIPALRHQVGDRAILRAMHFYADNQRVSEQVDALDKGDFEGFLRLIKESGNSSWKWLQNCFSPRHPKIQEVALALAVTEDFLDRKGSGACRVHGGGFAGTIQVFIPNRLLEEYTKLMEGIFGQDSVTALSIRTHGTAHWNLEI